MKKLAGICHVELQKPAHFRMILSDRVKVKVGFPDETKQIERQAKTTGFPRFH